MFCEFEDEQKAGFKEDRSTCLAHLARHCRETGSPGFAVFRDLRASQDLGG